jgi:2'-5' RNA ligase
MLVLLKEFEDVEIGKMEISELKLFQSKLNPDGPVYEEVFKINLSR